MQANGYISFGSLFVGADIYSPLSSIDPALAHLAVLGGDLQGTPNARIAAQATGLAPNRRFSVEWSAMKPYTETPSNGISITAKATFHEDGRIVIQYGPSQADSVFSFQVGLRGKDKYDVSSLIATTTEQWINPTTVRGEFGMSQIGPETELPAGLSISLRPQLSSVQDLAVAATTVSPQPALGRVHITVLSSEPTYRLDNVNSVLLVNTIGRLYEVPCQVDGNQIHFDVSQLASGTYSVRAGEYRTVLVVQR